MSQPTESVWDYPRPPRVEPWPGEVIVECGGGRIATSRRAVRVLETSHPPVFYLPPADVTPGVLRASAAGSTWCEFKGRASYWDVVVADDVRRAAAWSYPQPRPRYEALRDLVAFYPGRVDACYVDGERVRAQDGDFYGGWVTGNLVGPFKGGPGTAGW